MQAVETLSAKELVQEKWNKRPLIIAGPCSAETEEQVMPSSHHEARGQFEQVIRREQEQSEPDGRQLVHCHTRLMEIGEALEIRYLVHLHRGIGPSPEGVLSIPWRSRRNPSY